MRARALASDLKVELIEIGHEMNKANLPKEFIATAVETAFEFEGVYDLMKMWEAESDKEERLEIIADIQDMIDDCSLCKKRDGVYVRFDDLSTIAKDVRAFKDNLRLKVDQIGSIKKLAELTGIPQPSLSRFFSNATMPRRITLIKIARALNLSQVEIAHAWAR